jgi:hypothetical protein
MVPPGWACDDLRSEGAVATAWSGSAVAAPWSGNTSSMAPDLDAWRRQVGAATNPEEW